MNQDAPTQHSTSTSKDKSRIEKQEFKTLSKFFPFYDQLSEKVRLPDIINLIVLLVFCCQSATLSLWEDNLKIWGQSTNGSLAIKWINIIFFFKGKNFIDYALIAVFLMIIIPLILWIIYKKTRSFNIIVFIVSRLLIESLPLILMLPIAKFTSSALLMMMEGKIFAESVSDVVLAAIELVLIVVMFSISLLILSNTIYIQSKVLAAHNIVPLVKLGVMNALFAAISVFINIFPIWTVYVMIALHLVLMVFTVISYAFRPMMFVASNAFVASFVFFSALSDIVSIVCLSIDVLDSDIIAIALLVLFILSIVASVAFFAVQSHIIKRNFISRDEEENDMYERLKITSSRKHAFLYLSYALENRIIQENNFNIIKHVALTYNDIEIKRIVLRLVAFFPSEMRLLNVIEMEFVKEIKVYSFRDHFLEYQLSRLKIFRQCSSSIRSNLDLRDNQQMTNNLLEEMGAFWGNSEVSDSYLLRKYRQINKMNSYWMESISTFPNSAEHYRLHTQFLVECKTDFSEGIIQKYKMSMVENGKDYYVDIVFKSFARAFPLYLKKKILTAKGNFLKSTRSAHGTTSNNNNNSSITSSTNNLTDQSFIVEIGKSMMSQPRIRLALQKFTEERRPNSQTFLDLVIVWNMIVFIVLSAFVFVYFRTIYDKWLTKTEKIALSSMIRYYLFSNALCLMYALANDHDLMNASYFMANSKIADSMIPLRAVINMSNDQRQNSITENVNSRNYYNSFLDAMYHFAINGENVYEIAYPLFYQTTNIFFCSTEGKFDKDPSLADLMTASSLIFISASMTASESDSVAWFEGSRNFCNLMKDLPRTSDSIQAMRRKMTSLNDILYRQVKKNSVIIVIAATVFILALTTLPFILAMVKYYKEVRKFGRLLLANKDECKRQLKSHIMKTTSIQDNEELATDIEDKQSCNTSIVYMLIVVFLTFVIIIEVVLNIELNVAHYNQQFNYMNTWLMKQYSRKTDILQCLVYVTEAILMSNSSVIHYSTFSDVATTFKFAEAKIVNLDETDTIMSLGDGKTPPFVNYDARIDAMLNDDSCTPKIVGNLILHSQYMCSSAYNQLRYFKDFVLTIKTELNTFHGRLDSDTYVNLAHLVSFHLIPTLKIIDSHFTDYADEMVANYKLDQFVLFIVALIIDILALVFMLMTRFVLKTSYKTLMIFLRRVQPIDLTANKELMDYLFNRKSEDDGSSRSIYHSILHDSSDSIIALNRNGIIEEIVSNAFGFTPDMLLGQRFDVLFDPSEIQKITNQLTQMLQNSGSLEFEDHTVCVTESGEEVICKIMIFGMKENNDVSSFVFIIRDETELIHQQKEAEEAKQNSEKLLNQILPRSIIARLNQGEKDISFTVKSATMMFIDVVKFSEYSSRLTPHDVLNTLSTLFGKFDEGMKNFDMLYKIKLIGDVYMCAGGLFSEDVPAKKHAEQMIRYGLSCLTLLEEVNIILDTILTVRIGINTGGPLIAGVLGTKNPVFDIIGDPINVASRLQSTSEPGFIQISEETYNEVRECDFSIDKRGEVYLKGKGKRPTYEVKQTAQAVTLTSILSRENSME